MERNVSNAKRAAQQQAVNFIKWQNSFPANFSADEFESPVGLMKESQNEVKQRKHFVYCFLFFAQACHERQIKTKRSRRWFDCSFTSSRQLFFSPFANFCLNEFLAGCFFFNEQWNHFFFSSRNTEKPKLVQEKKQEITQPRKEIKEQQSKQHSVIHAPPLCNCTHLTHQPSLLLLPLQRFQTVHRVI